MTVTGFRQDVLHWNVGEVIHIAWMIDGKQKNVYLLAKNGQRYTRPHPSALSAEDMAIIQSLWPDARTTRQAEALLLVPENRVAFDKTRKAVRG